MAAIWRQRRGESQSPEPCVPTNSAIRQRPNALEPAPRAELLHVLMLPDFDRAGAIGEFWGYPESRSFAELLIHCEEGRILRAVAVLVGMLLEAER